MQADLIDGLVTGADTLQDFVELVTSPNVKNIRTLTFHVISWLDAGDHQSWYEKPLNAVALALEALVKAQPSNLERVTLSIQSPQYACGCLDWNVVFPSEPLHAFAVIQDVLCRIPTLKALVIDNQCLQGLGLPSACPGRVPTIAPSTRASYQQFFSILHSEGKLLILPIRDRIESTK